MGRAEKPRSPMFMCSCSWHPGAHAVEDICVFMQSAFGCLCSRQRLFARVVVG